MSLSSRLRRWIGVIHFHKAFRPAPGKLSGLPLAVALSVGCAFAADSTSGAGGSAVSSSRVKQVAPANTTPTAINASYDKAQATLAAEFKSRIAGLKQQIEATVAQIRQLNAQREALNRMIAKIEADLAELDKLQANQEHLKSKIKELQEAKNTKGKALQETERKTEELKARLAALNRQSDTLSAEFQQAVARLEKEREQALKSARR